MTGQIREAKFLEAFRKHLLWMLNERKPKQIEQQWLADGRACLFYNSSSASGHSSGDKAFYLIVKDVVSYMPDSHKSIDFTPNSHLHGPMTLHVVCESPETFMDAQALFMHTILHSLRGLVQSPVYLSAAPFGTIPAVAGMLGAAADANIPEPVLMLPSYALAFGV